jgi:hypothetical protein
MDEQRIEALRERTARLQAELRALTDEAGDFPAVAKNAARIKASLAMIQINLGLDPESPAED